MNDSPCHHSWSQVMTDTQHLPAARLPSTRPSGGLTDRLSQALITEGVDAWSPCFRQAIAAVL